MAVWNITLKGLKRSPCILLPFTIVAFIEGISLSLLFLAPRPPLSTLLAPPIRKFVGESYLHYPYNFLMLPSLFDYVNIIITIFIASLMIAWSVGMIKEINEGNFHNLMYHTFISAIKRYLAVVIVYIIVTFLIAGIFNSVKFLSMNSSPYVKFVNQWTFMQMAMICSFLITIAIESFFVYIIPLMIISKRGIIRAIKESFSIGRQIFLPTFFLILIPNLLNGIITYLEQKNYLSVYAPFPEVTLFLLGGKILLTLFTTYLTVVSITILFLWRKGKLHETIES